MKERIHFYKIFQKFKNFLNNILVVLCETMCCLILLINPINCVVNKYLNGHLSRLCNWLFSAPQKKMLQNFYMIKKLEI